MLSEKKTYSLKPMVMARALAELSVLLILLLLAPALLLVGQFFLLPLILRIAVCLLSPLALFLLYLMLKIPYKVTLSQPGLELRSISKSWNLVWSEIESLKQVSRAGFQEYVLVHKGGKISFPCLFTNLGELVKSIRQNLPGGGRSRSGLEQVYRMPRPAFLAQLARLGLQAAFLVLFLCFFISLSKNPRAANEDLAIILAALLAFALLIAWKFFHTLRQATEVLISPDALKIKTAAGMESFDWSSLGPVSKTGIFYPDGLLLTAGKRKIIISVCLDAFDELADELQARLDPHSRKPV